MCAGLHGRCLMTIGTKTQLTGIAMVMMGELASGLRNGDFETLLRIVKQEPVKAKLLKAGRDLLQSMLRDGGNFQIRVETEEEP